MRLDEIDRETRIFQAVTDYETLPADRQFWLSFVDSQRPKGQQFLGVAIVLAPNEAAAMVASRRHDCNPGGEVAIIEIPSERNLEVRLCHRLLSRDDLKAEGLISAGQG